VHYCCTAAVGRDVIGNKPAHENNKKEKNKKIMYMELQKISDRPAPFSVYTVEKLWNDPHISEQMLKYHLDPKCDSASRNKNHITKTVDWLIDKFKIDKNISICDFGCGPGLYSIELAKTGAQITGIDFSKRSIEYAKKQASICQFNIEYLNENYLYYSSDKKFDLILLIYLDYCVLSLEQRKQLLSVFYKCLKDDGLILFDVLSINAYAKKNESSSFKHNLRNGFWSKYDYFGFEHCFKYDDLYISLDKYSIVENTGIWHVYNWFQYYSKEMIEKELLDSNFKVTEYFSNTTGETYSTESNEIVIIGKKYKT
jgi:2-polyprenyl-3-methyl-5-hydroxy-6-metoxy-1,4-benzoquinol methylase